MTQARKEAARLNATGNFCKAFKQDDPDASNTGIAFLIVCDMLLTGFDAPIEQVMYIDKKLREHTLLQAIARTNRVSRGKKRGYIVDYIGLANHLTEALTIYAATDELEELQSGLQNISTELPVLEERYQRLLQLFDGLGVKQIRPLVNGELANQEANAAVVHVAVRPPRCMTPEQVDETVFSKRMWIYRNLAEWQDLNATRVAREWVNGETFLYLGSGYRLSLVDEQDEALKLKDGRFQLQGCVMAQGGREAAQRTFEQFYADKGLPRIQQRVFHFAPRVGVAAGEVKVKDLGYRWASCQPSGELHFHWKCLMAPLTVIDYIVVHELCHLRHRDHSDAFWNEVDKVLPQYRERKEWLRQRGANLDI